ncbi:MAG: hypothetical protein JST65_02075, partial [Acidobacteria bacterium]|nr:hypothetical protein [Acidobacteriota bacterium]
MARYSKTDTSGSAKNRGSASRSTPTSQKPTSRPAKSGGVEKAPKPALKVGSPANVAKPILKNARPASAAAPTGGRPERGRGFRSGPPPAGVERPQSQRKAATVTGEGKRPLKTLERVLSKAGLCSRTDARSLIGAGRVTVNGHVIRTPDHWVDLGRDRVALDEEPVRLKDREDLYIVLNKPKGYITTYKDPEGRPTVYELVKDLGEWV